MDYRILVNDKDLAEFAAHFATHSGIQLPYQYLRNSKVHGIYLNNAMVGGFVFTSGEAMRWCTLIALDRCEYMSTVDRSQLFEINGVWISPGLRKSRRSIDAWNIIIKRILAHDKPIPTFAFLSEREGLGRLYRKISGVEVFHGPMLQSGKMLTVSTVSKLRLQFFRLTYLKRYIALLFVKQKSELESVSQDLNQEAGIRKVYSRSGQ